MTREEAVKMIKDDIRLHHDGLSGKYRQALNIAIKALQQPEIIRCKGCKWSDWYTAASGGQYCYCMETGASGRTEDDFCSYAERQEEGDQDEL